MAKQTRGKASEDSEHGGPEGMDPGDIIESNWHEIIDNFDNMNLKESFLRGIYANVFENPSAIQQRTIIPYYMGETCHACIGGTDVWNEMQKLQAEALHIAISFSTMDQMFVLDEADEMLSRELLFFSIQGTRWTEKMHARDFTVYVLQGDIDQKERDPCFDHFCLLAHGIDVQQVSLVIYYIYLLIGGDFGRKGVAINFVTEEDKRILCDIETFYILQWRKCQ
ncbi:unnamed protein product [Nyctereutes procyonoides]|uniref:ATP-dependent RNA helicase n=1 Tax=Nyctereutes procyonoides TaxID=34880 RepID=A0A811ZWA8_NYCPR|nr:unnamed protein product [Nyctereutes procyonoides]